LLACRAWRRSISVHQAKAVSLCGTARPAAKALAPNRMLPSFCSGSTRAEMPWPDAPR
jgi:hypothetical protein